MHSGYKCKITSCAHEKELANCSAVLMLHRLWSFCHSKLWHTTYPFFSTIHFTFSYVRYYIGFVDYLPCMEILTVAVINSASFQSCLDSRVRSLFKKEGETWR